MDAAGGLLKPRLKTLGALPGQGQESIGDCLKNENNFMEMATILRAICDADLGLR
jgi:hypothetical protein